MTFVTGGHAVIADGHPDFITETGSTAGCSLGAKGLPRHRKGALATIAALRQFWLEEIGEIIAKMGDNEVRGDFGGHHHAATLQHFTQDFAPDRFIA